MLILNLCLISSRGDSVIMDLMGFSHALINPESVILSHNPSRIRYSDCPLPCAMPSACEPGTVVATHRLNSK
jgi:hypothetical protein